MIEMQMPEIVFKQDTHQYFVDGIEKIFPSKVLKELHLTKEYGAIDPAVVENAALRGSAVHKLLEYKTKGELDQYEIHEELRPYLDAHELFLQETKFKADPTACELKLYSAHHDYCCTLDIVGVLDGEIVVIDYKTSSAHDKAVELQTAAQFIAYNEWNQIRPAMKRFSLQLRKNGKYTLRDHSDVSAFLWLDALKLHRWKNAENKRGKREVVPDVQTESKGSGEIRGRQDSVQEMP